MSVRVSFVIVSHSASLADGVCELAAQMAPDVHFEAAGGTDDGRIGTSYDLVETALEAALAAVDGEGSGVIVLTDLGSATMTVESVIDMSDEPERVRFVDTCLVEGAVASSVRAQLGEDLDQVADVAAALAPAPGRRARPGGTQPLSREAQRGSGRGPGLVDVGAGGRGRRRPRRPARATRRRLRAPGGHLRRRGHRQRGGRRVGPGAHGPGHHPRSERPHRSQWGRRHSGGRGADRYAGKRNTATPASKETM